MEGFCESVDFAGREAIEEEVGDDEIIRACGREAAGIDVMDTDAASGMDGSDAGLKKMQHSGALVNDVCIECVVGGQKAGEKAAISVAEDESTARGGELRDAVEAAAFEHGAEGAVLEPTVGPGDGIKVGGRGEAVNGRRHQRMKKMSRRGVSRAASAAMRRWKAESLE